ncbi:MAG: hypothetical protein JWO19_3169 [Bryobacterales bacterium]|nr:hypothetical protein [Bryobacterales bacterium]
MSRISTFFKGADVEFGVFYPKHCLLAVFENLAEADRAKEELAHAGFGGENVISVSGEEVVRFAEDQLLKDGLWGVMMTELSRIFGTEAVYADQDLAAAKKGAAFLAVHCPTEEVKAQAWKSLEPRHPVVARYYSFGGIEHLAGET